MVVDVKNAITKRVQELEGRADRLLKISDALEISGSIQFSMSEVWDKVEPRKEGLRVGHSALTSLESVKGPVVYFFEMVNASRAEKQNLIKEFKFFRSEDNKDEQGKDLRRASAKIIMEADEHVGSILYVGSVKKDIASRVRQHLGHGNRQTYSLQLRHWVPKETQLVFHYILLPDANLTLDVETAISAQLSPLLGKQEK